MTRKFITILSLGLATTILAACAGNQNNSVTNIGGLDFDTQTGAFSDPEPAEGGWQAFADILKKAEPSVNTAIPLTPSELAQRVAKLIDDGQANDALAIIEKQQEIRDRIDNIGLDVQLQYQKARAYAALGDHDTAMGIWQTMTQDYPELPEPWNALAIEYARNGQLDLAQLALENALATDPDFKPALENLGHIQMKSAEQYFKKAKQAPANTDSANRNPSAN